MPGWLQVFARHEPLTYMVDAVRGLTLGRRRPQEGEGPMTEETMPARGSTESVMPQAQPATAVQEGTAATEVSR